MSYMLTCSITMQTRWCLRCIIFTLLAYDHFLIHIKLYSRCVWVINQSNWQITELTWSWRLMKKKLRNQSKMSQFLLRGTYHCENPMLTNGTVFLVAAVSVIGLPNTLVSAILRLRAVAFTRPTFHSTPACWWTGCPWRPGTPTSINWKDTYSAPKLRYIFDMSSAEIFKIFVYRWR